jgi:hypothetical protein
VIEDTQTGSHHTLWNKAADDMVARDPQRYQYVDAPKYWKGIDYWLALLISARHSTPNSLTLPSTMNMVYSP